MHMEADAFTRQETGSRVVRGILTNAYAWKVGCLPYRANPFVLLRKSPSGSAESSSLHFTTRLDDSSMKLDVQNARRVPLADS